MTLTEWPKRLKETVETWLESRDPQNRLSLIVSPDFDGALSVLLLSEYVARHYNACKIEIVGVYDVRNLFLVRDATRDMHAVARRALWLDHDMFQGLLCIGNHLISVNQCEKFATRNPKSFNLNLLAEQSWNESFHGSAGGRDKCMFSTATVLAFALHNEQLVERYKNCTQVQLPPSLDSIFACLAHADSFWSSAFIYKKSLHAWFTDAFEKGGVPNWLACMKGYCENELAYSCHARLIQTIQHAYQRENGLPMSKNDSVETQRSNSDLPLRWRGMAKQQTLGWNNAKSPLQRFFYLCDTILATDTTFFALSNIAQLRANRNAPLERLDGQLRERNPREWLIDSEEVEHRTKRRCTQEPWLLCNAVAEEDIISLAIINRKTIKYTVDLPLRKQEIATASNEKSI